MVMNAKAKKDHMTAANVSIDTISGISVVVTFILQNVLESQSTD